MKCVVPHWTMPNGSLILLSFVFYTSTLFTATTGMGTHKSLILKPNGTVHSNGTAGYSSIEDNSTLTQGFFFSYSGSLVSPNGTFKLGFFVRGVNTFLGICYSYNEAQIVWVANRDNPIPSQLQHNVFLVVREGDGIPVLSDSYNRTYWSTGLNSYGSYRNLSMLQLLDTGNLVLLERGSTKKLWESFNNPTDTILQAQWRYFNISMNLTSWKSPDNPAPGDYSFRIPTTTKDYSLSITQISSPLTAYWIKSLSSLPGEVSSFLNGSSNFTVSSQMLVLTSKGIIELREVDKKTQVWSVIWSAPEDQCDLFVKCGDFTVCDAENSVKCKCLPGYINPDPTDQRGDCTKRSSGTYDGVFLTLPMVKLPASLLPSPVKSEDACKNKCLNDRECKFYSFDPVNSTCSSWSEHLDNIQEEYYKPNNCTLNVRVNQFDIDFGITACGVCGANVIPYPLRTRFNCGNPAYNSFQCNDSNGQLYFKAAPNEMYMYKVSNIDEKAMKFSVQLPRNGDSDHKCDGFGGKKLFNLSEHSPYSVTNCSFVSLIGKMGVVEVEMSWIPPPPPPCKISPDCNYWPNTTCHRDHTCKCADGFHSDHEFLNCTKEEQKEISLFEKIGIASACGIVLLIGTILCILHRRREAQRRGITEINKDNDIEDTDIPFVDYESILYATNNFSDANKLGAGGFGPVYQVIHKPAIEKNALVGELVGGNPIAVKRLSAASVQGIEEFRNEVILIAKLQHRNLVRVLGYCVKENEKILIYEYMPNKSLDAFLFDQTLSPLLDWIKRFEIINGIARGLLYLHQDSRLKIIHRDMKPSNILLDQELNPKISDFGLARIVAGNETSATTARIVGTHGYMSPEYALDGYFSIKSDVYSFGIIVLEIISGKRCAGLLHFDNNIISLLGYAWYLWDAGKAMDLVDNSVESYDIGEVKRCINVGLLCVQEDPSDRPTMSRVLMMLSSDGVNLPSPKQPVFVSRKQPSETASSSSSGNKFGMGSNVELITIVEGR